MEGKTRHLVNKCDTKTPLPDEWEIYDSFATTRKKKNRADACLYTAAPEKRKKKNMICLSKRLVAFSRPL